MKTKNPLYREIQSLLNKRRNCVICIVGSTGTGKSLLACKIAADMDKTFNVAERVVSKAEEFMELVSKLELGVGSTIILDEMGVGIAPSREWQSWTNRAISYIVQSFRHRGFICLMTVPSISFIDAHLRKLLHFLIVTKSVNFRTKRTSCRVFRVEHNPRLDKTYYKRLSHGRLIIYDSFQFRKVREDIAKDYETKARTFKNELAKGFSDEAERRKIEKVRDVVVDENKVVKHILADLAKRKRESPYLQTFKSSDTVTLDIGRIEAEFGVGYRASKRIKDKVRYKLGDGGLSGIT